MGERRRRWPLVRRGDVYLVTLDPTIGSEANKVRPAVIVSNNAANRTVDDSGRGVVTVVPITSNVDRVYRFQVLVPGGVAGLSEDSKIQAEQIRSIDGRRLRQQLGRLDAKLLAELDRALVLHLDL